MAAGPARPVDASCVDDTEFSREGIVLSNGVKVPFLGLGTWRLWGEEAVEAVAESLRLGYRHIDTASIYENEEQVREGIARSGIPRSQVFITSKLWHADHGEESALAAFEASLRRLGTDYIDLYLIHWPGFRGLDPMSDRARELRAGSWRALERLYAEGRIRAIGVSNYMVEHLEELVRTPGLAEKPHVNQIEWHPLLQQREVVRVARENGVAVMSYSSLARCNPRLFEDEGVKAIAARHGKVVGQVVLRWAIQHGVPVVPKSSKRARLLENASVFDFALSAEELAVLDALDLGEEGRICKDPTRTA